MRRLLLSLATMAASSAASFAQVNLLPSAAWGFAPVVSGWHFTMPLATPGGAVQDVAQAAVPFQVRAVVGERWTFDVTGAYLSGAIHTISDTASGGNGDNVTLLSGPTDVKVRLTGPLLGDKFVFTAGANIPTGTTRLNGDETAVLQAIGAPALQMPISAYGVGAGGTLGIIGVIEAAGWALALGGSVEHRTEYTPIALALAAGSSETRLTPGTAMHGSLGADRIIGEQRLSLLILADAYGTDNVVISDGGTESGRTHYQLGPQVAALARLDFGGGAWSEGALSLSGRHRAAFNDADGKAVSGSDGNYFDGSLGGVLGGGNRAGLVIGVDGHWQSGLPFTSALVGAAATTAGATLGLELPHVRLVLHPQYGTFDTGLTKTTGFGGSVSLSFFAGKGRDPQ